METVLQSSYNSKFIDYVVLYWSYAWLTDISVAVLQLMDLHDQVTKLSYKEHTYEDLCLRYLLVFCATLCWWLNPVDYVMHMAGLQCV